MWHPSRLDTRGRDPVRSGVVPRTCVATYSSSWGRRARLGRAGDRARLGQPEAGVRLRRVARCRRRACRPRSTHTAALPGTDVDVSPAPETDTANPHTQISFLGAPAAQIRDVAVVGRRSGAPPRPPARLLAGRRRELRAGRPFANGERVDVRALIGAGAAQARELLRFRVDTPYSTASSRSSQPAGRAGRLSELLHAARRASAGDDRHHARPRSRRRRHPHHQRTGPGQYGPLIYTPQGRLVWFERCRGRSRREPQRADATKAGAC